MYNEEYYDKLDAILNDEEFAEAARNAESKEQLQKLFAERGLETEDEMVQAMFDKLVSIRNGEELTEEDLALVAGGGWRRLVYSIGAAGLVVAGAATGNPVVFAMGVGAALQLTYYGVKKDREAKKKRR